jgi:hypothetical protein
MTKQIIDKWLEEIKKDLISNYDRLGLRASGNWANQLESFNKETEGNFKLGIIGERYTGALENGRKPTTRGNKPGILRGIIRRWIDVKGIIPYGGISKDSLAFLITRKIHRFGIRVPNAYNKGGLLSDVVTREKINELIKSLSLFYLQEIKTEFIKTLHGNN